MVYCPKFQMIILIIKNLGNTFFRRNLYLLILDEKGYLKHSIMSPLINCYPIVILFCIVRYSSQIGFSPWLLRLWSN